jgi:hypothetical protein
MSLLGKLALTIRLAIFAGIYAAYRMLMDQDDPPHYTAALLAYGMSVGIFGWAELTVRGIWSVKYGFSDGFSAKDFALSRPLRVVGRMLYAVDDFAARLFITATEERSALSAYVLIASLWSCISISAQYVQGGASILDAYLKLEGEQKFELLTYLSLRGYGEPDAMRDLQYELEQAGTSELARAARSKVGSFTAHDVAAAVNAAGNSELGRAIDHYVSQSRRETWIVTGILFVSTPLIVALQAAILDFLLRKSMRPPELALRSTLWITNFSMLVGSGAGIATIAIGSALLDSLVAVVLALFVIWVSARVVAATYGVSSLWGGTSYLLSAVVLVMFLGTGYVLVSWAWELSTRTVVYDSPDPFSE